MRAQFDRRYVLRATTGLLVTGGGPLATAMAQDNVQERQSEQVTPPEDLMREHGVLNRVLLIYEAGIQNIEGKQDFDPVIISNAAQIVQQFIEGYHERNEEQQVFPRFRKAGQLGRARRGDCNAAGQSLWWFLVGRGIQRHRRAADCMPGDDPADESPGETSDESRTLEVRAS
jgi:hypothetical protein